MSAMFMHPMYSSALSSVRFKIDVSFPADRPIFAITFSVAASTTPTEVDRIALHLKKLEVKNRIIVFCVRNWSFWRRKVETLGIDIKALFLLELGTASSGEHGQDWATAFMKGVLRDTKALAALNTKSSIPLQPLENLIALEV